MDAAQKLIQAFATLLWPLIVVALLFLFRPAVAAIIDSARSRKFTLKIGGQELTMEEANQVQQKLIADLQIQVSDIQQKLTDYLPAAHLVTSAPSASATLIPSTYSPPPAAGSSRGFSLLWVDDNPKNNSYFIQQLLEQNVRVDLARSTVDGLARFEKQHYDCIVSDMGRVEEGKFNPTAGLDLLQAVRIKSPSVLFVIFSSSRALATHSKTARDLGANLLTSSPTELTGMLNAAIASHP